IASGSGDKTVRLWDAQSSTPSFILSGHTASVLSVTYSPNGLQIASGSHDNTVRLWDAHTGALGLVLSGHTGGVVSVTYSPNGHQMISGSTDATVRLWDVASGQCLVVLVDVSESIASVSLIATLDGVFFATGSGNFVRTWEVVEEEGQFRAHLLWSSAHSGLSVSGALIQDAHGLSKVNIELLRQRRAVGDPTPPLSFREASWKIAGMASVASRFKASANISTPRTS
ncbi:hypothetical protein BGZ99_006518, partial [Dissophora globulifera]